MYRYLEEDIKMPFGKHKGELVKIVIQTDPEYLLWFAKTIKSFCVPRKVLEKAHEVINEELRDDLEDYTWHDAYNTYRYGKND